MNFEEFFKAVWGHDSFPWQNRLAALALAGQWPSSIGLPTAAGKTALIDIAVYALAMGAPKAARRIFFVVDRRIIVDEAALRAEKLAKKLLEAEPQSPLGEIARALRNIGDGNNSKPLITTVLRGCIARDDSWASSPRQPAVICSTVDQVGSSLLFRAYGRSEYARSIRAGLTAHDSLIILDEAHTSQPFVQTLHWIQKYRTWAEQPIDRPFTVVEMSATPRNGEVFREDDADRSNEVLKKRWEATKHARLALEDVNALGTESKQDEFAALVNALVREARAMRDQHDARVIGVIANRVRTARAVFEVLSKDQPHRTILLTGRARAYDRDETWKKWSPSIALDREAEPDESIFVIATQCIEVGANIDFDSLVTEIASLDALEQRFGRLNRKGREVVSKAVIVAQKDQIAVKYEDYVYGKALAASWSWLKEHLSKEEQITVLRAEGKKKTKTKKTKIEFVEMGVLAFRRALELTLDRSALSGPRRSAPVLLPAHADQLCQTSPEPALSPDPAIFLHGPQTEPADVQVVWRQDLNPDHTEAWANITAICPPSAAEAISLPIWAVRQWLGKQTPPDLADIEGLPTEEFKTRGEDRPVLCWRGPEKSEILKYANRVGPGMMIVVPVAYGGCDQWGWNPTSAEDVLDVGDPVKLKMQKPMLRLAGNLAERWCYQKLGSDLNSVDSVGEARILLKNWLNASPFPWVREAVQALLASRLKLIDDPSGGENWAAITGRGVFEPAGVWSFEAGEEPRLEDHLNGCGQRATAFSADLPARLRATVIEAAAQHDIGKADPRFQAWLRGGNPTKSTELIAKSKKSGRNAAAIERARVLAGYPKGGRHELMSVALLSNRVEHPANVDVDLLLHLVGSHHGCCRPFAPVIVESEPVDVTWSGRTVSSNHGLERAGSGVTERFWLLTRRYGWYGLAYLETLVRLADQRQSEAEENGANEMAGVANV